MADTDATYTPVLETTALGDEAIEESPTDGARSADPTQTSATYEIVSEDVQMQVDMFIESLSGYITLWRSLKNADGSLNADKIEENFPLHSLDSMLAYHYFGTTSYGTGKRTLFLTTQYLVLNEPEYVQLVRKEVRNLNAEQDISDIALYARDYTDINDGAYCLRLLCLETFLGFENLPEWVLVQEKMIDWAAEGINYKKYVPRTFQGDYRHRYDFYTIIGVKIAADVPLDTLFIGATATGGGAVAGGAVVPTGGEIPGAIGGFSLALVLSKMTGSELFGNSTVLRIRHTIVVGDAGDSEEAMSEMKNGFTWSTLSVLVGGGGEASISFSNLVETSPVTVSVLAPSYESGVNESTGFSRFYVPPSFFKKAMFVGTDVELAGVIGSLYAQYDLEGKIPSAGIMTGYSINELSAMLMFTFGENPMWLAVGTGGVNVEPGVTRYLKDTSLPAAASNLFPVPFVSLNMPGASASLSFGKHNYLLNTLLFDTYTEGYIQPTPVEPVEPSPSFFLTLSFDTDISEINSTHESQISELLDYLVEVEDDMSSSYSSVKIMIVGSHSNIGEYTHNIDLANKRAENTYNALVTAIHEMTAQFDATTAAIYDEALTNATVLIRSQDFGPTDSNDATFRVATIAVSYEE